MPARKFRPDSPNFFSLPTPEDFEELSKLGYRIEGLSSRQKAVLAWLAHGKSNNEIVRILKVSRNTIEREITLIFNELGVENRLAASVIFIQWKLQRNQKNTDSDE